MRTAADVAGIITSVSLTSVTALVDGPATWHQRVLVSRAMF